MASFSSSSCRIVVVGLLAACLAGSFFPVAGRAAGRPAAPRDDFIPLSEIVPGMTGYGLTVFEGARIDTFGVCVVGVQENVRADGRKFTSNRPVSLDPKVIVTRADGEKIAQGVLPFG